jgi:hypothetical protein
MTQEPVTREVVVPRKTYKYKVGQKIRYSYVTAAITCCVGNRRRNGSGKIKARYREGEEIWYDLENIRVRECEIKCK